ncbi:hypothetical protein AMECASPLE_036116 [Ameca splendens]|uniref:Secreted protein n=1 Tax=Ameca splendens TaxID=208324 RepID=A0ABV1A2X5_9TELE
MLWFLTLTRAWPGWAGLALLTAPPRHTEQKHRSKEAELGCRAADVVWRNSLLSPPPPFLKLSSDRSFTHIKVQSRAVTGLLQEDHLSECSSVRAEAADEHGFGADGR